MSISPAPSSPRCARPMPRRWRAPASMSTPATAPKPRPAICCRRATRAGSTSPASRATCSNSAAAASAAAGTADEITLFKSCGTAIEDLAAADHGVFARAAWANSPPRNPDSASPSTPPTSTAPWRLARALAAMPAIMKLGMEFFYAHGARGLREGGARLACRSSSTSSCTTFPTPSPARCGR